MARGAATLLAVSFALACAGDAHAVVKGTSTPHGGYTVRVVGGHYCSGVLIARKLAVTAEHCGRRGMGVYGAGGSSRVIGLTQGAFLDDGRFVSVSGDAVIMQLSRAHSAAPVPVGIGDGDIYTIVGYGAPSEHGGFGRLREARLVPDSIFALVDPFRQGSVGASACFGDSGGPVLRDGILVGIITRAAHPHPRIACGHLTRWTPVTAGAQPTPAQLALRAQEEAEAAKSVTHSARRKPRARKTSPSHQPGFIEQLLGLRLQSQVARR